jgi:two-component system sensor histidine kinase YesM
LLVPFFHLYVANPPLLEKLNKFIMKTHSSEVTINGRKGNDLMWEMIKRIISGSLRARLLTIFLLINIFILTMLVVIVYWRSSELLIEHEREQNKLELSQIASNLELFIQQVDIISKDFDATSDVQTVLLEAISYRNDDFDEQRAVDNFIGKMVVTHSQWLVAINMFDRNGNNYHKGLSSTQIPTQEYERFKNTRFYERIVEGKGKMVVGRADFSGDYIVVGRVINSTVDFNSLGILFMYVKPSSVTNYFDKSGAGNTSHYLLQDAQGHMIGGKLPHSPTLNLLKIHDGEEIEIEGMKYLASRENIPFTDWQLLKLTTINSIIESTQVLKHALWIVSLICGVLIILLSIVISRWITRPLNSLTRLMNKSIEERFLMKAPAKRLDEVGQLSRSYNMMMTEINELINKEYKLNLLNKEIELRSLQAQINPHFIYNTLDTMNWVARMNGLDEVGEMAESLANLLRIAIRDQNKPYRITEELTYISNYMSIQQYRFEDRFRVEMDIGEEVKDVLIPKLILQPLLENAIIHNVDHNPNPTTIKLSMKADHYRQFVFISVSDDGIGINQKVVDGLEMADMDATYPRGLANVHRRLCLNYGNDYGLDIVTTKGTTISFKIPFKTEGEPNDLQASNL